MMTIPDDDVAILINGRNANIVHRLGTLYIIQYCPQYTSKWDYHAPQTALQLRLNYIRNIVISREELKSRNYVERNATINPWQDYLRNGPKEKWEMQGKEENVIGDERWSKVDRSFCAHATHCNFPPRWKSCLFCRFNNFEFFMVYIWRNHSKFDPYDHQFALYLLSCR